MFDETIHEKIYNEVGQEIGYQAKAVLSQVPTFNLANLVVTQDGVNVEHDPVGNKYYPDGALLLTAVGEITDNDEIVQTAISASKKIKLPVTRHVDDQPILEEFYLTGTLIDGVVSVSGYFPVATNYKILPARVNSALDRLPAGFHLAFETMDFLV